MFDSKAFNEFGLKVLSTPVFEVPVADDRKEALTLPIINVHDS